MVHKVKHSLTKPVSWFSITLAIATAVTTGMLCFSSLTKLRWNINSDATPAIDPPTPSIIAVSALGRLEPQGEVIRLSAPNALAGGVRISQLRVKKGDRVRVGQVVSVLDSYQPNLAALIKAQEQVKVAKAALNQVKAGAKLGDIYAQKAIIAQTESELAGQEASQTATIASLIAQLHNAQINNRRYQQLYHEGAIAAIDADTKRLNLDTIQQQLNEANASLKRTKETLAKQIKQGKERLKSLAEVRPTDIQAAEANIDSAKASLKQAQADLYLSSIHSPIDGQVLKINAWPGEIIGNDGIADLGRTSQMIAVAEVYETDIKKVHLGQPCVITGSAFSGKLRGTVIDIGLQVSKQNIFSNNPGADTDSKVVNVKIRIDNPRDSMRVAGLTNLQVEVSIGLDGEQKLQSAQGVNDA